MNGRAYFEALEQRMRIAGLDPATLIEAVPALDLPPGPRASRVGGSITTDLKRLTPEEIADRRERSEAFLREPVKRFPTEESAEQQTPEGGDPSFRNSSTAHEPV